MTIQKYEDWMRPQVVALFNLEYGSAIDEFDKLFQAFYEHPFQRKECIRIVAVEGEKIAGFQSFFYWPIISNGRVLRSYQSGNSLVHPEFRGKGLFGRMLNFILEPDNTFNCELLIGFPVEASFSSFLRNKWLNPFNLQWFVKPLNPILALFSNPESQLRRALGARVKVDFLNEEHTTSVSQSIRFDEYRFNYEQGDFYRFTFEQNGATAFFELKAQRRKKIIKELVIGKFLSSDMSLEFVEKAFTALTNTVKGAANFSMISIAINPECQPIMAVLQKKAFRKIDKKIYFIAKGPVADDVQDWSSWAIYRSDIDTW